MPIHYCNVDLDIRNRYLFCGGRCKTRKSLGAWWIARLPDDVRSRLAIRSIGVPSPTEPYNLGLADDYEKEWRLALPILLSGIHECLADSHALFIWAEGPMDRKGGLPDVFPYMLREFGKANRYHIPAVTSLTTDTYDVNWFSYEYCNASFIEMMNNMYLDFEFTKLYAVLLREDLIGPAIDKSPEDITDLEWILSTGSIAMVPYDHFDGCYLAGEAKVVDEVVSHACRCLKNTGVSVVHVSEPTWWSKE